MKKYWDYKLNMAKAIAFAIALIMGLTMPVGTAFAAGFAGEAPADGMQPDYTSSGRQFVEGQVIVTYDEDGLSIFGEGGAAAAAEDAIHDAGAVIEKEVVHHSDNQNTVVVAKAGKGVTTEEIIRQLSGEAGIASVQPDYVYELLDGSSTLTDDVYNNNSLSGQYYLYNAMVNKAWKKGYRSDRKVTAAVLDTGCRLTHTDINANLARNSEGDILAWDAVNDMSIEDSLEAGYIANGGDLQGHGTHVCGIVGAVANNGIGIAGVSNNAKLLPVNVFTRSATGSVSAKTSDIVSGYEYLKQLMDERTLTDLRVINMSLGRITSGDSYSPGEYSTDRLLENAIVEMRDRGVLTVCAGGNGDSTGVAYTDRFNFPSDFDPCVAVSALDNENRNASFSDYNKYKDISAPGVYILSTTYRSDDSYGYMSGTSQASPVVAGAVALLWAQVPELTADEVVTAIKDTAQPIPDDTRYDRYRIDTNPYSQQGSAGSIDVASAITSVAAAKQDEEKISISDADVSLSSARLAYTGKARCPEITVKLDGMTLVRDTDYTVKCENNKYVGTAMLTLTGMGEYAGSKAAAFTIVPPATSIRSVTAYRGALKIKWNRKTAQVTGYQLALSKDKSFKNVKYVRCTSCKTTAKKVKGLSKSKKYYVKIRTYKTVYEQGVKKYIYSSWSTVKTKKTK